MADGLSADWYGYDFLIAWAMTGDPALAHKADRPRGPLFEALLADWALTDIGRLKEIQSESLAQDRLLAGLRNGSIAARGTLPFDPAAERILVPISVWQDLHFQVDDDGSTLACGIEDKPPRIVRRFEDLLFFSRDIADLLRREVAAAPYQPLVPTEDGALPTVAALKEIAERLEEVELRPNRACDDRGQEALSEDRWSLPMALAWASTRSLDAVYDHWNETDGGTRSDLATSEDVVLWVAFEEFANGMLPVLRTDEANKVLLGHLRNGRLVGARVADGARSDLPSDFWRGVTLNQMQSVQIDRTSLMGLFPPLVTEAGRAHSVLPSGMSEHHASFTIASSRRGRPKAYPWDAFEAETLQKLEYEGGIGAITNFSQADLERYMAEWCSNNWERQPAESTMREHVVSVVKSYEAGKGR